ncbi:MAG: alpha-amylase, partial [Planctomycetales bacterium 12-60-4]
GLADVAIPAERVRDPRELREPGLGLGRDPVRTPMPWDGGAQAGFSTAEPWLPLNADWTQRNVAAQAGDPSSMLALHRTLLALRRRHPALSVGSLALIEADEDVLAYERREGSERLLVVLNMGGQARRLMLPGDSRIEDVLASTLPLRAMDGTLRPDEGLILKMRGAN